MEINNSAIFENNNFGFTDLGVQAEEAFCEYAKYVTQDRALPDVRDGLKPVHRRILFAMNELGNTYDKPYKKSARIIGEVLGKFHPHGDSACYNTLARLCQDWVMSVILTDGQGNWGDSDKNNAAAMRYTEVRLSKASNFFMDNLKEDTVDWQKNYDGSELEPVVLPAKFPNLVINGVEGIGVGLACSIPPHNPIEALNCALKITQGRLGNTDITNQELMQLMPAPDLPTGGIVYGLDNYIEAWTTGRCKVRSRADWHEELIDDKKCIVVTNLPYGIAPSEAIKQCNEARKPDNHGFIQIRSITGERDETDEEVGLRLVFEVDYGIDPVIAFNELCNLKKSQFDTGIYYNINVVDNTGEPISIGLRGVLERFIDFREEVVFKRTTKRLNDAQNKMHLLMGIEAALSKLDETINLIRSNPRISDAKEALINFLNIDDIQAQKILELTLGKLTQGEISTIQNEINQKKGEIVEYQGIINNKQTLLNVVALELEEQIDFFTNFKNDKGIRPYQNRRSEWTSDNLRVNKEDLYPKEHCSVILSDLGFVRRISIDELKMQRRGTQGTSQFELAKKDIITLSTQCYSHDTVAFATSHGRIAFTKGYEIDTSLRGQHLNNILKLEENEKVISITSFSDTVINKAEDFELILVTKKGLIKRTGFNAYSPKTSRLVKAITINPDDELVFFGLGEAEDSVTLVSSSNKAIRFKLSQFRSTGRTSRGVSTMKMNDGSIISCILTKQAVSNETILGFVSQKGLLKLTKFDLYRETSRRAKGVTAMRLQENDQILNAFSLTEKEMGTTSVVSTSLRGKMNKVALSSFKVMGRVTQGISFVKVKEKDKLVSSYLIADEAATFEVED